MEKREFFFKSCDQVTRIHAIEWVPDGEIRAVPGLSRVARLRLHHASGGGDAGPLPQVRRAADEAHGEEQEERQAVHLLLL